MSRFDATSAIELIEEHRVTVLAAVSTQFLMLLESPAFRAEAFTSLRVMFTGGEAVPERRAAEFEERTGALVLQFYGSNETGALSRTTTRDDRAHRLRTAGRVIESMDVRLFGDGQPGCKGPLLSRGYLDDPAANAELYTPDGWMLTGDIVRIDDDGYLTVVGRASDFIIRGGKNVSAAQVEHEVGSHPAVALVAAVAAPDDVFGERVCAYVVLRPGPRRSASTSSGASGRPGGVEGDLAGAPRRRRRPAPRLGRQDRQGRAPRRARHLARASARSEIGVSARSAALARAPRSVFPRAPR